MKKLMIAFAVCALSAPAFAGKMENKAAEAVQGEAQDAQKSANNAVAEFQEDELVEKAKAKAKKLKDDAVDGMGDKVQKAATDKANDAAKSL